MNDIMATKPLPQAGWYPDPTGNLRWWDGYNWGMYASPPAHQAAHQVVQQKPPTGLATSSLVLGIIALLGALAGFFSLSGMLSLFLAFLPGVLSVTFGCVAVAKAKKIRSSTTLAGLGLALGAISLLIGPFLMFR